MTITVSERYEDGHKSWPTGVQTIQLLADAGLIDSKPYGPPTQPCERQTFEATYTVPRNPPLIVHLRAIAEDGVGNQASEVAEFPTSGQPGKKKSLPPWFDVKNCKNNDRAEKCFWTGVAPQSCNITVCVCGYSIDKIFDEVCTDGLWDSLVPKEGLHICCDKFKEGQRTHQPCDPTKDFDCDGVPNDKDRYPFDPNRSSSADAPATINDRVSRP